MEGDDNLTRKATTSTAAATTTTSSPPSSLSSSAAETAAQAAAAAKSTPVPASVTDRSGQQSWGPGGYRRSPSVTHQDQQGQQLEQSMRESEEVLRDVTRSIGQSWTTTGPASRTSLHLDAGGTASAATAAAAATTATAGQPHSGGMQPSSSTSSNLVQHLLNELDQVFTAAFAEDELRSMQKSITASEGTVVVSDDVSNDAGLQAHFSRHYYQQQQQQLQQLQQPQQQQQQQTHHQQQQHSHITNQAQTPRAHIVPLAELEEFSEENGSALTEDDTTGSTRAMELCDCHSPAADTDADGGGSSLMEDGGGGGGGGPEDDVVHANKALNGPASLAEPAVDMNGNGTGKHRHYRHSQIVSQQDLLDTFMDIHSVEEDEDEEENGHEDGANYDFLEFAEKYYNVHCANTGYTGAFSKTVNMVRRKSLAEVIPIEDLIRYTKSSNIPTSHMHLLNPDNVTVACSIFKDFCKYLKGEHKGDNVNQLLVGTIKQAIDRYELRDEIYCQLVRQTNENPHVDSCHRAWSLMCLCSASFSPCVTLNKYLTCYLHHQQQHALAIDDKKISECAAYCLRHLSGKPYCRKCPPSSTEVEAIFLLQPMVFRVTFMDGKTKAMTLNPLDTAATVLLKVQEKIDLESIEGWSLYESTPDRDRQILDEEYIADVLSDWEEDESSKTSRNTLSTLLLRSRRLTKSQLQASSGTPKKMSPKHTAFAFDNYGKIMFCKRVIHPLQDGPFDMVELRLLFAQAVHFNINDEYLLPASTSFHLAGLQAQVDYGDFEEHKIYRYAEIEEYLCHRILASDCNRDWSVDLEAAHKRYGRGKTEEEAMLKYLFIIKQCPMYGCSKIFAHYRGLWHFGIETLLAINFEGIKFISIQEKVIAFDFYYAEIETIRLEERHDEFYVIIQLKNYVAPHRQKCFMFECLELEQVASLIECYSPNHATWLQNPSKSWYKQKFKPSNDWLRLYKEILSCRCELVEAELVHKPGSEGMGLIRTAINRLSGRNCAVDRGGSTSEEDIDTQSAFWSFSKLPFKMSLMVFDSHEMADVASRMFNSTLVYTGIESAAVLEDMDLIVVVQTLIIKCMENDELCNEFYLQLIKQTTETHSESIQKACVRYWHLMTMATCVMLPPSQLVFRYLNLHLKHTALAVNTEEGKSALFCIKSLCRTFENKGRKFPPSFKEIEFVSNRQPIEVRVQLADAHQMLVEFDSATTATEMMQIIKAKVGMRLDAEGYGIYEMYQDKDVYLMPEDKIADSMYKWELWSKHGASSGKDIKFLFKKRLFVEPIVNVVDPMEVDLLYHQSVTDVFEQKIPLTRSDATELCALRAQTEYGDYGHANHFDYTSVMRILPRHLRDLLHVADMAAIHKRLAGTAPVTANVAFLEVLKHWPLYGAAMFDVTQTYTESLPRTLWLAVCQLGVHLMEYRGQSIYCTYPYESIVECTATSKNLSLIVGSSSEDPSLLFITSQGQQVVQLIEDYKEYIQAKKADIKSKAKGKGQCAKMSKSKESLQKDGVT